MPLDPSILIPNAGLLQSIANPQPIASPQELQAKQLALQNARLQSQSTQMELQQRQQDLAAQQTLDQISQRAFKMNPDGTMSFDHDAIAQGMIQAGFGHKVPALQQSWTAADKAKADLTKTNADIAELQQKAQQQQQKNTAFLAHGIAEAGYDKTAALTAIAGSSLPDAAKLRMTQQVQAAPDANAIKAMVDPLWTNNPDVGDFLSKRATTAKAQEETERLKALLPGEQKKQALDITKATQETTGTQPISPYQVRQLQLGKERNILASERVNLQRELMSGSELSDDAADTAARMYNQTGNLPALGMGPMAARNRDKVLNRAAVLAGPGGADIAGAKASYAADTVSLKKLQTQRDAVTSFENVAGRNLDLFINLSKQLTDTGSPLLNLPIRTFQARVAGDPKQAAANAALQVAVNEIAKVTTNPNLSGQLSDSARKEVADYLPASSTVKQTLEVAKVLRQDMRNRSNELDKSIAEIKGRISGQQPAEAGPKATHRFNPATGKIETIP